MLATGGACDQAFPHRYIYVARETELHIPEKHCTIKEILDAAAEVSHLGSFMSKILLCADLLGGGFSTFISLTSVPAHDEDGAAQRNCLEFPLSELHSFIPSTIFPANTRREWFLHCLACALKKRWYSCNMLQCHLK
jgi:hypothetical protein